MRLPEFLQKAIVNNTTSLGSHPAFPPDEEGSFIGMVIKDRYRDVMSLVGDVRQSDLSSKLSTLVNECMSEEEASKQALEKLCMDICATIFDIPDDTVNIDVKLVTECDMSKYRIVPSPTSDFTFEDIDDMKSLSDEVYKRRMLNALISGASMSYAMNLDYYIQQIHKINPKLPSLYQEIFKYNNALLFNLRDTIRGLERNCSGKVDVNIPDVGNRISIDAEGVIFPVLLEYTIRGFLEIATLQGLPSDMKRAEYIMSKADYRLAENWDMRLGVPLWGILSDCIERVGYSVDSIRSNFIIMELSRLEPELFNQYLCNCFKKTRKGLRMTKELCDTISYNKGLDDFNNFIKTQNDKYTINDNNNDKYTADELLSEVGFDLLCGS